MYGLGLIGVLIECTKVTLNLLLVIDILVQHSNGISINFESFQRFISEIIQKLMIALRGIGLDQSISNLQILYL